MTNNIDRLTISESAIGSSNITKWHRTAYSGWKKGVFWMEAPFFQRLPSKMVKNGKNM
jgi:hypothetical protein